MVYTDIVLHGELGKIYVYWGCDGKVKEVSLEGSYLGIAAVPGNFAEAMPEVEKYLVGFGDDLIPGFTADLLDFSWCTGFMERVYRTLFGVPRGAVVSYGELAEMSGYPGAARAVGTAMRKNRFMLLIPCHRVIGSNSLGGFAGDMSIKLKLLRMEGFLVEE